MEHKKAYQMLIVDRGGVMAKELQGIITRDEDLMKHIRKIDIRLIDTGEDVRKLISEEMEGQSIKWQIVVVNVFTPMPEKEGLLIADILIPHFESNEYSPARLVLTDAEYPLNEAGSHIRKYIPKYMKYIDYITLPCKYGKNTDEWINIIRKKVTELNTRQACHKFGKFLGKTMKNLSDEIRKRITEATRALQECTDEDARCTAVKILGEIDNDDAVESLFSALETESSTDVRIAIIEELSFHLHEERISLAITAMKNDENPLIREKVEEVLQREIEFSRSFQ